MNNSDFHIEKTFSDDVENFCDAVSTLSDNSVLQLQNIQQIEKTAKGIPIMPVDHTPGISLPQLCEYISKTSEYVSTMSKSISAVGINYVILLRDLRAAIIAIESSGMSEYDIEASILQLAETVVALSELYNMASNGKISGDAKTMIEQYFAGEIDLTTLADFLKEKLGEISYQNADGDTVKLMDEETASTLEKLIEKITKTAANKLISDTIKTHFGEYGMIVVKATEGLIFKYDISLLERASDFIQTYAQQNQIRFLSDLSDAASKNVIGATFMFNFAVAMVNDFMDDNTINDLEKNLALSLYSAGCTALGAEIGTAIGGPIGTVGGAVIGAALDVIGTVLISNGIDDFKDELELRHFSQDDLDAIRDSISIGLIDDERVPAGTTLFDAAYRLRRAGFPNEVYDILSNEQSDIYMPDGKTLKPEVAAIIYIDGGMSTPSQNVETAKIRQELREIIASDSTGELRAYVDALGEYYSSIRTKQYNISQGNS